MHFASELRYLGHGHIESTEEDGNHIVHLTDGRRGRVGPDQCFATKREALAFCQTPQPHGGWADAARLGSATVVPVDRVF